MDQSPSVSIVICAYNAGRFLAATLDSVLGQTFGGWECVILDDGSTDDTAEVARKYHERDGRIRLVQQANMGLSSARNNGTKATDPAAPYIVYMDSDDVWTPDALATLKEELDAHPDAAGSHGVAELIDTEGKPIDPGSFSKYQKERIGFDGKRISPVDLAKPTTFEVLITHGKIYPPGIILAKKKYLYDAGLFDLVLKSQDDWDMWIRLSRYGDIRFVPKVILYYRRHDSNMTNKAKVNWDFAHYVRHKTFYSKQNSPRHEEIVRGAYRAWQRMKIDEKLGAAKKDAGAKDFKSAAKNVAHIFGHAYRYLRGYPTAKG